jgi:thioredoxin reductase
VQVEVAVVGGGPAGLSAALVLGRCCREVLLVDSGRPRNPSARMHCFLGRDDTDPAELREVGRAQLARYPTVKLEDGEVIDAGCAAGGGPGFVLTLAGGRRVQARKLLLATGMVDELPPLPGLRELWGRSAFPCPYCDAWELRGQRLGVLGGGSGESAVALCRALTTWSDDVVLYSHAPAEISAEEEAELAAGGVPVVRARVQRVRGMGPEGRPVRLSLEGHAAVERDALFVSGPQRQRSPLVERLGCRLNERGTVDTGDHESTNVPGLFVAGDASGNVQFAIVAAAEGAEAGFAINRALVREDFARRGTTARRAASAK